VASTVVKIEGFSLTLFEMNESRGGDASPTWPTEEKYAAQPRQRSGVGSACPNLRVPDDT